MSHYPSRSQEDLVIPKTDEDDDMEELFTAVATATDGGRCISEAYKVLPSRTVSISLLSLEFLHPQLFPFKLTAVHFF